MTNVFVTSRDPVACAQALDTKRLLRMCLEAYDALCGALANHRYGSKAEIPAEDDLPWKPKARFRHHNVIRWAGADGAHFRWLLRHAQALQAEAWYRRGAQNAGCSYYQLCNVYCAAHADEIPTTYTGDDPNAIEFYLAMNHNEFRSEYSYAHAGRVALPAHVDIFTRYQLSLIHKWEWIDVRENRWGLRGPPAWATDEVFHAWCCQTFGPPKRHSAELYDQQQTRRPKPGCSHKVGTGPGVGTSIVRRLRRMDGPVNKPLVFGILNRLTRDGYARGVDIASDLVVSVSHDPDWRGVGPVTSSALYSADQTKRYFLSRVWDATRPPLIVCMLNPSTATELANDPTVTRVESVARRLGMGGYIILNWAAHRVTDSKQLRHVADPVGPHNVAVVRATCAAVRWRYRTRPVILVAWGATVRTLDQTGNYTHRLLRTLRRYHARVVALQVNTDGSPRHPLYIKGAARLKPYVDPRTNRPTQQVHDRKPHQRTVQRRREIAR